ncbi:MAG: hypothetical protein ABFR05_00735 [Bacteroidota bacterium]
MKILSVKLFLFLVILIGPPVLAQDVTTVKAADGDISDNLDLEAVASIFGESKDLEDFERRLNDPKTQISNLDLNNDGEVDYLRVVETTSKSNLHTISIQSIVGKDLYQEVATIDVQKDKSNKTQVQVVGNVDMYGPNYCINPVYPVIPVFFTFFWMATYRPWYSPWYWGYHPPYWHPWNPYPPYYYRNNIHVHINVNNSYHRSNVRINNNNININNRNNAYFNNHPNKTFNKRNPGVSNRTELNKNRKATVTKAAKDRGINNKSDLKRAADKRGINTDRGYKSTGKPVTKPSTRPSTKPAVRPTTKPATRPSTKPANKRPSTRPSTRPSKRPASRPNTRSSYSRPTYSRSTMPRGSYRRH